MWELWLIDFRQLEKAAWGGGFYHYNPRRVPRCCSPNRLSTAGVARGGRVGGHWQLISWILKNLKVCKKLGWSWIIRWRLVWRLKLSIVQTMNSYLILFNVSLHWFAVKVSQICQPSGSTLKHYVYIIFIRCICINDEFEYWDQQETRWR